MISRVRECVPRAALAVALLLPSGASALESSWVDAANAKVRILAGGRSETDSSGLLRAGIEIRLARGWHTYWRYAGDAGIPPRFDWTGSANLESVEIRWPAPARIRVEDGIESIGYENSVVLPLRLKPQDSTKPVSLSLKLDFGVCEKICIPASAKAELDIPKGSGAAHPILEAAEARIPAKVEFGAAGKLRVLGAKLDRGTAPQALIDVAVPPGMPFDLFAEGPGDDWALPLPKRAETKVGRTRFVIPIEGAPEGAGPTPKKLRLTLVAGSDAIEVTVPLD